MAVPADMFNSNTVTRLLDETIEQLRAERDQLNRLIHGAHRVSKQVIARRDQVEDELIDALREQGRRNRTGALSEERMRAIVDEHWAGGDC